MAEMRRDLLKCKRGRERWSAHRPLTHSLESTKEGLAMKATHCYICGATLDQKPTGHPRIVCSSKCAVERRKRRRHEAKRVAMRPCSVCGTNIPAELRRDALYCSSKCTNRAESIRAGRTPLESEEVRFWSKVDVRDAESCWEWKASRSTHGYGRFGRGGRAGGMVTASRMAYELTHGPIPAGVHIRHRCNNPPCCNPEHLTPGSHDDNMRDMAVSERSSTTKLTAAEVLSIRREYADGAQQRTLAAEHGVSQSNIAMVVSGRTWKHIGGPTGSRPEEDS